MESRVCIETHEDSDTMPPVSRAEFTYLRELLEVASAIVTRENVDRHHVRARLAVVRDDDEAVREVRRARGYEE